MRSIIILLSGMLAIMVVVSCGDSTDYSLDGEADLNLNENFTECQIRLDGSTYFVRATGGFSDYTMAIDPSIVYTEGWLSLEVADSERLSVLTQRELDIINGVIP